MIVFFCCSIAITHHCHKQAPKVLTPPPTSSSHFLTSQPTRPSSTTSLSSHSVPKPIEPFENPKSADQSKPPQKQTIRVQPQPKLPQPEPTPSPQPQASFQMDQLQRFKQAQQQQQQAHLLQQQQQQQNHQSLLNNLILLLSTNQGNIIIYY